ncbi:MAG: EAL domain-containing protein [Gammaproteobacteria bacterium]|nr:EAL domain-containing protein [Gammaproteobacteria bacterium]
MNIQKSETSLSFGVGLGFVIILLLMVVLTSIGLSRMADINRHIDRIVKENNVKMELAHAMKDALRERAVTMHTISLLEDPFDQNEEFSTFSEHADNYAAARQQLDGMDLSAEEKAILSRIRNVTSRTQPLVVEAVDKAMGGKRIEARDLIVKQIIPAQKLIALEINELLKWQKTATEKAISEAAETYENARLLMLTLGAVIFGLSLVIAFIVIRNAARQTHLLKHQALYDILTNLPNRALFADRLWQSILIGRRENQPFALIALDLDRFKEINDSLGHHIGDQVLQQVAARLRACLRESDTVARMGGDEFVVLLPTISHLDGAIAVAQKILKSLKDPLSIPGQTLEVEASLGIAMFPEHAREPDALMRQADAAMYVAKKSQTGYTVYNAEIEQKADDRAILQGELRRAISNGELVLHYQPKVDCDSNRISGVEALVRWQHPVKGLLYPDKFILLAEQSALIKPLTMSVLKMALRQGEEWYKSGLNLTLAVNISAINIQDPDFPAQVAVLLKEFEIPATLLELEVTETAVMTDPVRAVECIKALSALGLQISIDDFGTGYSSMTYLKELLVAKIKIDKSFVKDMAINHNDAVIVRSTVELGHNLGLKVIAEGVENQAAWDELKLLGCDSAQGYYMARPLPPDKFMEWLRQSPWGQAK